MLIEEFGAVIAIGGAGVVIASQSGHRLREGMAFTVEPMINAGTSATCTDADGWTVRTADGALSAQFEHTVLIGPHGAEITTVLD